MRLRLAGTAAASCTHHSPSPRERTNTRTLGHTLTHVSFAAPSHSQPFELELSWLCEESGWKHTYVPAALKTEVEEAAKKEIEDAEMEEDEQEDEEEEKA